MREDVGKPGLSEHSTPIGGTFALLTSPGPAAIAVLRLVGGPVAGFLQRHVQSRHPAAEGAWKTQEVWRAKLVDAAGALLDEILVSVHAPPPVWDLRLHLHGSPWLVRRCGELLRASGFAQTRATGPLWPAGDAIEAEAYALLSEMRTLRGARWLLGQTRRLRAALERVLELDSLEEGRKLCGELAARAVVFNWFSRPARVALVGPPNAGKSTLANALADQAQSLVSATPGTTRDWVDVAGQVHGFPVVWLDTAGLRPGGDALEAVSMARTRELLRSADAVVVVLDATEEGAAGRAAFAADYGDIRPACVALNKADLAVAPEAVGQTLPQAWQPRAVVISAAERSGLEALTERLTEDLGRDAGTLDHPGAFTRRQVSVLKVATAATDKQELRNALRRCLTDAAGDENGV